MVAKPADKNFSAAGQESGKEYVFLQSDPVPEKRPSANQHEKPFLFYTSI